MAPDQAARGSSPSNAWRLQPWSARSVLRAWERGKGLGRTGRALALLSTVLPGKGRTDLLDLPLGRRDQLLLQSRVGLLGETLQGSVHCPSCGAEQAFALEITADLLSQGVAVDAPQRADFDPSGPGLEGWSEESVAFEVRAPNGHDALAVENLQPVAARRELFRRTVALRPAGVVAPGAFGQGFEPSADLANALGEVFETLDPLALVPLALSCGCGLEWQPVLEVVEILWAEVENLAGRLMDEAQTLAMAYGWSEEEIFAMSGRRRRYYLEKAPRSAADEESSLPLPNTAPWSSMS